MIETLYLLFDKKVINDKHIIGIWSTTPFFEFEI